MTRRDPYSGLAIVKIAEINCGLEVHVTAARSRIQLKSTYLRLRNQADLPNKKPIALGSPRCTSAISKETLNKSPSPA